MPPTVGRDHRDLAGHRLEVDQAERLVHRRAAEDGRVRVELHGRGPVDHLGDPHDSRPLRLDSRHGGLDLSRDLGRVGRPGAQHDLDPGAEVGDGLDQVEETLLPGDPSHEEHVGASRVDPEPLDARPAGRRAVGVGVDSVRDDVHPLGCDRVVAEKVPSHLRRDGDDRVRGLEGGALGPRRDVGAPAELLALPRPERLDRVSGHDQRDAVDEPGQETAERGVPGVGVDDVGVRRPDTETEADAEGPDDRRERVRALGSVDRLRRRPVALHHEAPGLDVVAAEGSHLDGRDLRQLPGEVLDVHAGAPVDVGRILTGEQEDLHADPPATLPSDERSSACGGGRGASVALTPSLARCRRLRPAARGGRDEASRSRGAPS